MSEYDDLNRDSISWSEVNTSVTNYDDESKYE